MTDISKKSRRRVAAAIGLSVSLLALTATPAMAQNKSNPNSDILVNSQSSKLDRLLKAANSKLRATDLQKARFPVVRIVSPLNGSTVAPGLAKIGQGSPEGNGYLLNIEIVTRDSTPILLREATLAPPVFGIRRVPELEKGKLNPDVPGLGVFFDVPLVTPDGKVFPAFHNFASAFNVAGTDDTPGPGVTAWLGWHVLESMLPTDKNVTLTVTFEDVAGRVGFDQISLKAGRPGTSGQSITPGPETFTGVASAVSNGRGPELSMIAPRVPSAIAVGPKDSSLNANNGSLFFIHLSAVDRSNAGIAVSETGLKADGTPLNPAIPFGLIFDPSVIPNAANGFTSRPNRNVPGMIVTFDVPLRQPSGNVVPAGTNLAGLFDIAGSEIDENGRVRTTFDWVIGGSLQMPPGKETVKIDASITDNAGNTGTTSQVVSVSTATSGQDLTANPKVPTTTGK